MTAAASAGDGQRALRHRENTAVLGMVLFIASWAMLFAALFFAYGFTRARALAWPPLDLPRLPLGWPALASVAIAGCSAALSWARRHPTLPRLRTGVFLALAGAVIFLAVQLLVWRQLMASGLRPDGGPYASVFYGLTAFHALHVAVGVAGLLSAWPRKSTGEGLPLSLRLWTLYVHMVGILWGLIFVGVYCL